MNDNVHTSHNMQALNIVVFGLSITSSWGNGHATTYRSLLKALAARGHHITFFERDVPWYAKHRDMPAPDFCGIELYRTNNELQQHSDTLTQADLIIVGSYVRDSKDLIQRLAGFSPPCFAFYDIDTPVTLAKLAKGDYEYLHPSVIEKFDIYLSFTGGPVLQKLENDYGARRARALYCSVDPDLYRPSPETFAGGAAGASSAEHATIPYALGYLGTYSDDRQPTVNELLIATAKKKTEWKFCLAGSQYPETLKWPENIHILEHVPPHKHCEFYNTQRFTLNVTRRDMILAGYSPSVRLFEAAACGTPVISDYWQGLDSFFDIGSEILVANNHNEVLAHLSLPEEQRLEIGQRLREKVLRLHTSHHRARELECHWREAVENKQSLDKAVPHGMATRALDDSARRDQAHSRRRAVDVLIDEIN